MSPTGYTHPEYAAALAEFGTPQELRRCGGWILKRPIPGTPHFDATGCYPLFACGDWTRIPDDLNELDPSLVSLVLVADPFGPDHFESLAPHFNRGLTPYKEHFVVDLRQPLDEFITIHHRRNIRAAMARLRVEFVDRPSERLDDWQRLYAWLIERHGIRGISAFSRRSFERQFAVPGLVALRAISGGETVGMILWYTTSDIGYYHLAAYDERGYELGASFALFWESLNLFRGRRLRHLNLGAGAGVQNTATDGLTRFKRGWATGTRTAWLGRHVINADRYADLCRSSGEPANAFFPAYRAAEGCHD